MANTPVTSLAKRNHPEMLERWSQPPLGVGGFDSGGTLEIQRVLARLFKRKYQILLITIVVIIPAVIATYLITPLYRSTALIQTNADSVQVMPYRDIADRSIGGVNFENYMGTQEQILKGQVLRDRVVKRLDTDFKNDPSYAEKSNLAEKFAVKKIEKSQLFEISYQAPSPDVAARIVNLFAEEYAREQFEGRQKTREMAEQDLKKEMDGLEKKVQLSEKEMVEYARKNNIMSLEQGQVDPVQQKLATVSEQVSEAEATVAARKSSLASAQKSTITDFPEKYTTQQIGQLDSKLFQLEQELSSLRRSFGENWPTVVQKQSEIVLVKDQLRREKSAVLARNLEQSQLDLEAADAKRSMLAASLAQQTQLVNQFHNASIQYKILKREVETNRNLYNGLMERMKQNSVLSGFQFANIQIVEPGRPNRKVYSPDILYNVGLAALLGLSLGLCVALLLDFWNSSISTLEEAEELGPIPSLGVLPQIKALGSYKSRSIAAKSQRSRKETKLLDGPTVASQQGSALPSELTESVRGVCASILLSKSDRRPRVIVVTSATPNEGKTTLVSQLGRAFAEAGSKTLMIEADLRKPDLSRLFAVDLEGGLSPFLAGHVSPSPKIHQTSVSNLHLIAAGPTPPNPVALLNSEKLTSFLQLASAEYQFVIIDTPPLLAVADARVLGTQVDGVVLVVRAGQTPKHLIRRAWAMLETSGAQVLGMVLNGAERDRAEGTYYNYYYKAKAASN